MHRHMTLEKVVLKRGLGPSPEPPGPPCPAAGRWGRGERRRTGAGNIRTNGPSTGQEALRMGMVHRVHNSFPSSPRLLSTCYMTAPEAEGGKAKAGPSCWRRWVSRLIQQRFNMTTISREKKRHKENSLHWGGVSQGITALPLCYLGESLPLLARSSGCFAELAAKYFGPTVVVSILGQVLIVPTRFRAPSGYIFWRQEEVP